MKRSLDLISATAALLLLSPVLILVSALVWMFLGFPIFFRQKRIGHLGSSFECLKFRTMTDARDGNGNLLSDAERLTAFGMFLRNSSLDELPELINVIRGEMSLVGPRPLLAKYLQRYSDEQMRRHDVLPGITGWAQINGRNASTWDEKFAYDLWYVDHRNLWLDIKILILTMWKIVRREGISQPGHATMPEFMGNLAEEPRDTL
jgi:lipopolysaccharide/colanic/teichoic acid biosynthesis glycosyltransferase